MTNEQKDLLFKDLCARLPYNVKCLYRNAEDEIKVGKLNTIQYDEERIVIDTTSLDHKGSDVVGVFPYLYPLSSMTEEQEKEFSDLYYRYHESAFIFNERYSYDRYSIKDIGFYPYYLQDWFNANHFDYRGLIDKGLAIDATDLNIY